MGGKKKRISNEHIKYIYAPQYESLSLSKIWELILEHKRELLEYFPDRRDLDKLPRQYVLNVIYTITGKNFAEWIQEKIKERNASLAKTQDLMVEMDPEIYKAFTQST